MIEDDRTLKPMPLDEPITDEEVARLQELDDRGKKAEEAMQKIQDEKASEAAK